MARTTAEIDGDSSGLVGALDKGKKGMQQMEAEGKKLSDQLREVTDSADKAAGAFVQKIGGPGAIKAIGGIGVAMGAAKMGVDAFLGSAESLFKSFGDEGMKVWDDTEKALFSIKGAFAEAVLGGGSVEQMGARLKSIFEGVKTVLDAALTPIKLLSQAFIDDSVAANQAATATKLYNEAVEKSGTTTKTTIALVSELTQKYLALTNQTDALKLAEIGQSLAKVRMQQAEVWATEKAMDEARANIAVAGQREQIAKAAWERFKKPHERAELYPGSNQFYDPRANETLEGITADLTARALVSAREKEAGEITVETRLALDQLKSLYESFGALYAEVGKVTEPPKTNGITKVVTDAEGGVSKLDALIGRLHEKYSALTKPMEDAMTAAEEKVKAGVQRIIDYFYPPEDLTQSWEDIGSTIMDTWGKIKGAFTRSKEEMTDATKKGLTAEQEAQKANYDQFVNQNAKMVAISLAGGAKMADVARQALGNIVSALGDKAMTQAGIEFATGNVGMAAALTAAGAAAYATAAYLGANDKKSASATKATAAPAAPVTNNQTNFNLRVDAAFADEESIARSFARAQRLASNRYMGAS